MFTAMLVAQVVLNIALAAGVILLLRCVRSLRKELPNLTQAAVKRAARLSRATR